MGLSGISIGNDIQVYTHPDRSIEPYIKALSHLWGLGELTVIYAQNMDYSSQEEIEEKIVNAINEGLEICKDF